MKEVSSYINLENKSKIKLDANESCFNISKELIFSISSLMSKIDFNRYPENTCRELREAYAKCEGIDKENVLVGNGSDEMINLIISANINKGKKILTFGPDFSMYDFYASINEGILLKYPILAEKWDVEKFIDFGINENVDLIIFSNPNNPTGLGICIEDIEKILKAFKNTSVVIDEAYYEFYGITAIPLIYKYKNLFVTRTLSKVWGMAALRVGFLISNKEEIKKLSKYKVPFNVNSISQKISIEVLNSKNSIEEKRDYIINQRNLLYKELKNIEQEAALDIKFYESKGNFIYGETPYKEALLKALNNKGISIRVLDGEAFRISVGTSIENKKLIEVIKDTFVY